MKKDSEEYLIKCVFSDNEKFILNKIYTGTLGNDSNGNKFVCINYNFPNNFTLPLDGNLWQFEILGSVKPILKIKDYNYLLPLLKKLNLK